MKSISAVGIALLYFVLAGITVGVSAQDNGDHASLVSLFKEFRNFSQDDYRGDISGYPDLLVLPENSSRPREGFYAPFLRSENRSYLNKRLWQPVSCPVQFGHQAA